MCFFCHFLIFPLLIIDVSFVNSYSFLCFIFSFVWHFRVYSYYFICYFEVYSCYSHSFLCLFSQFLLSLPRLFSFVPVPLLFLFYSICYCQSYEALLLPCFIVSLFRCFVVSLFRCFVVCLLSYQFLYTLLLFFFLFLTPVRKSLPLQRGSGYVGNNM